jgi:hypothetical protein
MSSLATSNHRNMPRFARSESKAQPSAMASDQSHSLHIGLSTLKLSGAIAAE